MSKLLFYLCIVRVNQKITVILCQRICEVNLSFSNSASIIYFASYGMTLFNGQG